MVLGIKLLKVGMNSTKAKSPTISQGLGKATLQGFKILGGLSSIQINSSPDPI